MSTLGMLWLPTLLSAVVVFIVSSLIHMLLRWHRNDQLRLPNEDAVAEVLKSLDAGDYRMPFASGPEEMRSEAFKERAKRIPMAVITVVKGDLMAGFRMSLIQWFVYSLAVSFIAGHAAYGPLHDGASYQAVFHTVGLTAFLGYSMGLAQQSIWGGKRWGPTLKSMVDGLIYALFTAGVFGWLWPR